MNREELRERYDYHPDGYLTYRYNQPGGGRAREGERVGSISQNGYVITKIGGKHQKVHQLIYIYHYNQIIHQIDHINNDKTDNRIENLRDIPQRENCQNRLDSKMNGFHHYHMDENGKRVYTREGKDYRNKRDRDRYYSNKKNNGI